MSEWTAGGNNVTFEAPGDSVAGTITYATIEDGTDMKGNPQRKRILDIQDDEGTVWRLYVKPGMMTAELGKALRDHGLEGPRAGDKIAVVFETTKPSKTAGYNPVKVYSVAYKPGTAADAVAVGAAAPSRAASDLI